MLLLSFSKIMKIPNCGHECCHECAKNYFTIAVRDKTILEVVCPFCQQPKVGDNEGLAAEFFAELDPLIRDLVDKDVHDLFQRKIRDWTLSKDPNFKWCQKVMAAKR